MVLEYDIQKKITHPLPYGISDYPICIIIYRSVWMTWHDTTVQSPLQYCGHHCPHNHQDNAQHFHTGGNI